MAPFRAFAAEQGAGMALFGVIGVVTGKILNIGFPINKKLWTSSYVIFTAGLALLCLAFCYWVVDVKQWRGLWTKVVLVFGMNANCRLRVAEIFSHLLDNFHSSTGRSWQEFIYEHTFVPMASPANASLLYALAYVLMCWCAMWVLYRKGIFLKTLIRAIAIDIPSTHPVDSSASLIRLRALLIFSVIFFSYAYFYEEAVGIRIHVWTWCARLWSKARYASMRTIKTLRTKVFANGHYYSDKAPGLALLAVPIAEVTRTILRALNIDPVSPRGLIDLAYFLTCLRSLCRWRRHACVVLDRHGARRQRTRLRFFPQ